MPRRSHFLIVGFFLIALLPFAARAAEFAVPARGNIVIFGDSITADGTYGQIMQDLIDQRFPDRQIRVLAHGAAGDTARGSYRRVEDEVVAWRPAWVLINFGINDLGAYSAEEYLRHYETLINRISRDTSARIGIISPIHIDRDGANAALAERVKGLQELAKRYHCLYIPAYEEFARIRPLLPPGVKYAVDGIHPNRLGYWIFAETILKSLDFPFEAKPVDLSIPSRHLTEGQADTLVGQTFTVDLPTPLKVTVTNPPPPQVTITRAPKPVTIDGKLDEWTLDKAMLVNDPTQRTCGVVSWKRDEFEARAFASYNNKFWYFAIVVNDSLVRNAPGAGIVDRDCIEVFLDLRTPEEQKTTFAYTGQTTGVAQYIIAPTPNGAAPSPIQVGGGDQKMLEGTSFASTLTKDGYIIEFSVPAARFQDGKINPGQTVGFDFSVNNADRFDKYFDVVELRWSGSGWSFFSTQEFGRMTFAP